ncbi:Glycosyltransferase family 25 (LPS biosynthesis protein) [Oceanospirillum multiglobuliferum]|uniref:glycosyltransferase n=1 Tax=Oceanospirillum multiglobuliferum TaxID=64969 RepID=UPI0009CC199D|nr:glycosyltransferase [Oceanospirillum multiglobuliferum]SJZ99930.1 Glycosyltransferase family 25 (LPS biosynthesis protein) [Oceanospirillum multiglobuliferum]
MISEPKKAIKAPLVSVLTRTKDRTSLLKRAALSVAEQTYENIELVIVNDGGVNVSEKEIITHITKHKRAEDIKLTVINLSENIGRSAAANKALDLAKGQYLIFLDDDDWINPDHISKLVNKLESNKSYIAAYSDTACVPSYQEKDNIIRIYSTPYSENALLASNFMPIHSVLFRSEAIKLGCQFDSELSTYEDWHFWLQIANHGLFLHVPGVSAFYSGEHSGIGFLDNKKDYFLENALFFKKSIPFLSPQQIASLQYSYREFNKLSTYNNKLEAEIDQYKSMKDIIAQKHAELIELNNTLKKEHNRIISIIERIELSAINNTDSINKAIGINSDIVNRNSSINTESIHKIIHNQSTDIKKSLLSLENSNTEKTNATISKIESLILEQAELSHKNTTERLESQKALLDSLFHILRTTNQRIEGIDYKISALEKKGLIQITKRLISKTKTLIKLAINGDLKSIKERTARNFPKFSGLIRKIKNRNKSILKSTENNIVKTFEPVQEATGNTEIEQKRPCINIVTPRHTLYIANLLKKHLDFFGFNVEHIVDSSETNFTDDLYIVIAPQICEKLPGTYIAYQLEQTVSTRWFTEKYYNILEHSFAILDYSKDNIKYIQENSNIHYKQMYYVPISNNSDQYLYSTEEKEYDVVFYGDPNNERRRQFLDAISGKYRTLIISEVFGEELYDKLSKGKILVNIHYYENALLETTRLYEALSLGMTIVSESSSDIGRHQNIANNITITPIGDIDSMIDAIQGLLENYNKKTVCLPDDIENFRFYLGRMLIGTGLIDSSFSPLLPSPVSKQDLASGVGLSLPESWERNESFCVDFPEKVAFPGLRHLDGWKGCALSYKYLAQQAISHQLQHIEIFEDDVSLTQENRTSWEKAKLIFHKLEFTEQHCDLLSGILADVSDNTKVIAVLSVDNKEYAVIDRMISAVCNYYGEHPIKLMSNWDDKNDNINTNTMDRYLESSQFRVLVPLPFIAGHKPEKSSTLWNFKNNTYDEMIAKSEKKLLNKVKIYKESNSVKEIKL